jgi:hypothetical protein
MLNADGSSDIVLPVNNKTYEEYRGHQCEACGATRCPPGYYAPWLIERAHIVNKPRVCDRRVVVLLCSICHKFSHGERLSGLIRPRLEVAHLLAIKLTCDPQFYDPVFMQRYSVRLLPEPAPLPEWYEHWHKHYGAKEWG